MRFCFDVDIGGVDMLVPAELRQSGSLPCLSVAVRWKARARAPGNRAGERRNVVAGEGRSLFCGACVA